MVDMIKGVPIPTAGVALGLAALGNLLAPAIGVARPLCGILAVLLVGLVISKILLFPQMIRQDFKDPILASVSATLLMALMQLSGYIAPFAYPLAFALWLSAIVAHGTLMVWFTLRFFRPLKLKEVFPTYFICYVGIIVAAVTSPIYGMEAMGRILFWIGFACYPVLLALVTYRYVKHDVAAPAQPLFCIYTAPASLSIAGYLSVTEEPNLAFVAILLLFAQACFALVVAKLPQFIRGGFFPSYAAMTFPFVITATALMMSLEAFSAAGYPLPVSAEVLCTGEMLFATGIVTFVLVRYVAFLTKPFFQARAIRSEEGVVEA